MLLATCYCDHCGASNTTQATVCFACGQPLHHSIPGDAPAEEGATLALASLLKERYRIVGLLGKGGFAAVYKAQDTQFNNRLVAIKEMSRERLTTQELQEATEAFKSEAQLLAGLTHPNLPRIYDQFGEQGRLYLVMDFIEGETLSEYLTREQIRFLPLDEALDIGMQLCAVLSYLHTRQPPIIFRDLKPDNIMRAADGQVYLIDFGIARHFKLGQVKDTVALGSPGYAAPEQYGRAQTTSAADIYGLGATLHFLLSGDDPSINPFRFAWLHESRHDVPAALDALLIQMLDMDVRMRPTDDEVRRELKRIATSPFLSEKEDTYSLLASSSQQNGTQGGIPLSSVGQAGQIQSMVTPSPLRRTRAKSSTLSRRKFTWQAGLVVCLGLAALVVIPAVLSNNDNQRYANVGSNIANPTISTTNLPKNNSLYTLVGSDQFISNISWSPDGKYIAATDGFNLFVWRSGATSPTPVYTPNVCDSTNYYLGPIAWSPDSSSIALNCNGHVRVWNMQKNEIVLTYSPNSHGSINDLVWSPDGKYIATASDYMAVDVWNVMTGHRSMTYTGHTNPITVVAWSPNGKYVASGGYDQEVKVWDPTNGHTLLTYTGHAEWITAISWSSDSSRIASSDVNGIIHVWNARDGSNVTTLNTLSRINSMEWSPDGKSIATGTADGILRIYNAASWKYATYIIWNSDTFRDGDNLGGMVWSPDSKEIAYPLAQTIQVMAV